MTTPTLIPRRRGDEFGSTLFLEPFLRLGDEFFASCERKWVEMVRNEQKWVKWEVMGGNGQKWSGMSRNEQKWVKWKVMGRNGK